MFSSAGIGPNSPLFLEEMWGLGEDQFKECESKENLASVDVLGGEDCGSLITKLGFPFYDELNENQLQEDKIEEPLEFYNSLEEEDLISLLNTENSESYYSFSETSSLNLEENLPFSPHFLSSLMFEEKPLTPPPPKPLVNLKEEAEKVAEVAALLQKKFTGSTTKETSKKIKILSTELLKIRLQLTDLMGLSNGGFPLDKTEKTRPATRTKSLRSSFLVKIDAEGTQKKLKIVEDGNVFLTLDKNYEDDLILYQNFPDALNLRKRQNAYFLILPEIVQDINLTKSTQVTLEKKIYQKAELPLAVLTKLFLKYCTVGSCFTTAKYAYNAAQPPSKSSLTPSASSENKKRKRSHLK